MAKKSEPETLDKDTNGNISVDVVAEMKESYLAYAMSVITSRALPDVRDGLKPVHRSISRKKLERKKLEVTLLQIYYLQMFPQLHQLQKHSRLK